MRRNIVHPGADDLTYAIREIVGHAQRLEGLGVPMTWENIGDPVHKGEPVPGWIKEIVAGLAHEDAAYAYSPTKGVLDSRRFLVERVNRRGGAQIDVEDILFFNGLGDAISLILRSLPHEARVLVPSPAYPSHATGEGHHAADQPVTYRLYPERGWQPDLEELERQVRYNPSIAGILVINPNNPTGMVQPREVLEGIVRIAREHDLFVIFDEIYINLLYNGATATPLSDIVGDVCGISLQGISKEIPWPGSRCGWMEVYNQHRDPVFARYVKSLVDAKMLEVCATTLPQMAFPRIMADARYAGHLAERNRVFGERAREAYDILKDVPGTSVSCPNGAFYMIVTFDEGVLDETMSLPLEDAAVRAEIEKLVARPLQPDYRFVYYMIGATGIVLVPLTSFCCDRQGFRFTLLETDDEKRRWMLTTLAEKIRAYVASSKRAGAKGEAAGTAPAAVQ